MELVYEDPATGFRAEKTMTLAPNAQSQHWKLRFGETTQKTYRSRMTYFLPNNVRVQTDWQQSEPITTESDSLVIHSPFRGQIGVRVVPVLDTNAITEADLELLYRDADSGYEHRQSISLPGGGVLTGQTLTIPTIAADPVGATTTTTVVRNDGSVFAGDPTPVPDDRVVILSDGLGRTTRIKVQLAGTDLASAGLVAVRVRLAGSGEDGDRDEAFFAIADTGPKTVALVQPGDGPLTYAYEVIGYTTTGIPRPGVSGETSDRTLVLPLP